MFLPNMGAKKPLLVQSRRAKRRLFISVRLHAIKRVAFDMPFNDCPQQQGLLERPCSNDFLLRYWLIFNLTSAECFVLIKASDIQVEYISLGNLQDVYFALRKQSTQPPYDYFWVSPHIHLE